MTAKYHLEALDEYRRLQASHGLHALGSRVHRDMKTVFLRGRKADPQDLQPKVSRFSYPPPAHCRTFGRANIPKHPVFYAGDAPVVIANELSVSSDDWIHLAIFHTPTPVAFEYVLLLHDEYRGNWSRARDQIREHVENCPDLPEDAKTLWGRIQDTAKLFRSSDYQKTSAIAHYWLYERQIDGILYPSVRNDEYCNFALNPSFVDAHLELHRVHACRWKVDERCGT